MPPVSGENLVTGTAEHVPTQYDSEFLRRVRELTHYKPHLNRCSGGDRYRRAKREGERPITYHDLIALLQMADAEGQKHGSTADDRRLLGASQVASLLNAIIIDMLPPGAAPVVEVRVIDPACATDACPVEAQRRVAVAAARVVSEVEESLEHDAVIDVGEERRIRHRISENRISLGDLERSLTRRRTAKAVGVRA